MTYYDPNGATSGSVPVDGNSYESGQAVTIADNTGGLARDGFYVFGGWNTEDDLSGEWRLADDAVQIEDADLTLFAHWVGIEALGLPGRRADYSGEYIAVVEDPALNFDGAARVYGRTNPNAFALQGVGLQPTEVEAADGFGAAVAADGDYVVVGARRSGDDTSRPGAVYSYLRTTTSDGADYSWVKLTATTTNEAEFGDEIDLDEDLLVVGAPQEDRSGTGSSAGGAYVFLRTGANSWSASTELADPSPDGFKRFGTGVAVDGDYVVVGSGLPNGSSGENFDAYVYRHLGNGSFSAAVSVKPAAEAIGGSVGFGSNFGVSVDISGDYVIVGASGENDTGAAYIFRRDGADATANSWGDAFKLTASDGEAFDELGNSVAIDGDYAIVGAQLDTNSQGEDAGTVYVFRRTGTNTWEETGKIVPTFTNSNESIQTDDYFGARVRLVDNYAIVVASFADDLGNNVGNTYAIPIYQLD